MRKTLTRAAVVAGAVALVSLAGSGVAGAAEPGCLTASTIKLFTDPAGDIAATFADPVKDLKDSVDCALLPVKG